LTGTIWNTDFLLKFNLSLYEGLLTKDHIISNEVSKTKDDLPYFGYELEKENPINHLKDRYFLTTDKITMLPIKVSKVAKFSHKSNVFQFIYECETKRIPVKQCYDFRHLVDFYANYQHSSPAHWELARILIIATYCERNNIRMVSEASFGKDALVNIISLLNGGVSKVQNVTFAKLKQEIPHFDFIVCNEVGNLTDQERTDLQNYLFPVGAYEPYFNNNSVSIGKSKDKTCLLEKSHIIFHNIPSYYQKSGQKYFEEIFTDAIIDRFPALLMEGYVTEQFNKCPNIADCSSEIAQLKEFISTLNYYRQNPIINPKYSVPDCFWGFHGKELQRSLKSFTIMAKYLAEYSNSRQEFVEWCSLLNKCRLNYLNLIDDAPAKKPVTIEESIIEFDKDKIAFVHCCIAGCSGDECNYGEDGKPYCRKHYEG